MKTLHLSHDLALPINAVTQTFAFLARRGAGKTYAASKLCEEMIGVGAQVVVLDPVGVWWGLRLAADGKDKGLDIPVFGGLRGDIPLEPGAGAMVADLIVDRGISVILDLSQFEHDTDKARFASDWANRFYFRKKSSPSAVHIFLEECQEFVPQNPQRGEERMLHAFQRIEKLGRNFGMGVSLISQRPQEVNKKALNQTECMFAMQTNGIQERKTIKDWVADKGLNVDLVNELPSLPVGTAWVFSPQWLQVLKKVKIGQKWTFNASATPEVGKEPRPVKELAPVDLEKIHQAMKDVVVRAEINDPKALRRRIAELEAKLAKAPAQVVPLPKIKEVPVITEAQIKRLEKAIERFQVTISSTSSPMINLTEALRQVRAAPAALPRQITPAQIMVQGHHIETARKLVATVDGEGVGNGGLRRILIALAQRPAGLTKNQIGVRAGLSSKSGSFSNYLSRGRVNGWLDGDGTLRITEVGLQALGGFDPLPEGRELLAYWLQDLGGSGAARILKALSEAYPSSLTKEQLGEIAGMSHASGSFSNYLSKLRSLELIIGRGELKMSEELA